MKRSAGSILFFIAILINSASAQYQAALPFLAFPVSPDNAAMGSIGTALPANDAYGFLYNPAKLGYQGQSTNFSLQFYLRNAELGNGPFAIFHDNISSFGFNLGYNFEHLLKIPLSIGAGYVSTAFNSQDIIELQAFDQKDSYNAYALGIGFNYPVSFSAGITYKSITSALSGLSLKQNEGGEGAGAIDFGLFINVPVFDLIGQKILNNISRDLSIVPSLDFSIGYSQSNIGSKVYYIDPAQADPLPRIARAGYGISAGICLPKGIYDIELVHLDFGSEAEDYLIVRDSTGGTLPYQTFLGDISIGKNILGIKGDQNVYSHTGIKIGILESAEYMRGHISGPFGLQKTDGWGFRLKGLFTFLADHRTNAAMNFVADHIDLRYYNTRYLIDTYQAVSYSGIELTFSNFIFD